MSVCFLRELSNSWLNCVFFNILLFLQILLDILYSTDKSLEAPMFTNFIFVNVYTMDFV